MRSLSYLMSDEIAERDPILKRLLPTFIEHRRRDVDTILRLVDEREFDQIVEMGHNLKGTGRTYGHNAITDIGRSLEEAGRTRNAARVRDQADALAAYLARL